MTTHSRQRKRPKIGNIMPGECCDILQSQYTSVLSEPLVEKQVLDPHEFFMNNCDYCKRELVHICFEDHPNNYYPCSDSGYILIDKNIVKKVMSSFSTSLAAGNGWHTFSPYE